MKITVEPIRDSTIRTRKKKITTEKGETMSAFIEAERHSNPGRTRWKIELANDKEDRTRTNSNTNSNREPTENEAMRQLQMAWEEYEDEQKENTISYEQLASTLTEKLNELAEKDE